MEQQAEGVAPEPGQSTRTPTKRPSAQPERAEELGYFAGLIALVFGGDTSFGIILTSLGTAFALFSIGAWLDRLDGWGTTEFLAVLGFGALQVVLGSIAMMIPPRSQRVGTQGE